MNKNLEQDILELDVQDEEKNIENTEVDITTSTFSFLGEQVKNIKFYDTEEERTKFEEYKKNPTIELRNEISMHYIRLVLLIAGKWGRVAKTIPVDDLIDEGIIGLYRAIDAYDLSKSTRFSTCAYFWIQQAISRYIKNNDNTIRVPVHILELKNKIAKLNRQREINGESPLTKAKIQAEFGISDEQIRILYLTNQAEVVTSLNTSIQNEAEETDSELLDFIQDNNSAAYYLGIENNELKEIIEDMLQKYLKRFNPETRSRNEMIIRRRFGLNEQESYETLESISADMGITRERVRQVSNKFICYMKLPKNKRILKEFL